MEGMGVKAPNYKSGDNDAKQGGDKAARRGGANNGIVEHPQVDKMDHAGHASRAKAAMSAEGISNVEYYNGGRM